MPSIKNNFFHNLLFLLSNILFPLVSFSYAARILGPEGYGKIQFVMVFAQYFVLVAALGIPIFGIREIAKARDDQQQLNKLFSELLFISVSTTLIVLGVYLGIIFSFNWFQADLTYYLLGGLLVFAGFSSIDWYYNGVEQFRFLSIRSITIKAIALIALFLFVQTKNDLINYFLIVIFSTVGNNVWNLLKIRKRISFRFDELNFKKHIPVLLTLFGTTISISIYTVVDTLLLGFLADDVSVGFYTAAVKINKMTIPLVLALGTVLIPRIAQSIANNDKNLLQSLTDKSFSFICLIGIPMSFGLFVFAPEFVLVLSGDEYSNAILTMQITAPLVILIGFGHLFGFQLLIPAGLEKKYLYATLAGMTISVVLNLLLISSFKDKGTAIATVAGEILVSFISFYYVNKIMKLNIQWSLALKSMIASSIFLPIAYLLRAYPMDIIIRLLLAIIGSSFFYFMIQIYIFREKQLKEVYSNMIKSVRQ